MPQSKKILVSLPDELLYAVDSAAKQNKVNRSELIRNAMRFYIKEQKREKMREQMKKGYVEMGSINLSLAEDFLKADNELLTGYEENLSECE